MMKSLIAITLLGSFLLSKAHSDTTFGVGFGALYSGLGLNFGRITDTGLGYGALGCLGGSTTSSETVGPDGIAVSSESSRSTNCGVSLGFVSTTLMPGRKHGIAINIGYSYDTRNDEFGGAEVHLTPSYHYFFNGIERRGLNLGFGPRFTFRDNATETRLMVNLGFQF